MLVKILSNMIALLFSRRFMALLTLVSKNGVHKKLGKLLKGLYFRPSAFKLLFHFARRIAMSPWGRLVYWRTK
ncbi:MAG: hypothetical protein H6Q75_554 [Firmicutes bacterium]|nr:hypothetical protein [Bacillota bacterium]